MQRLIAKEWTSRVTATQLFSTAYPRVPAAMRTELRDAFSKLCRDETPMVRRAAAQNLGGLIDVVEPEHVEGELLPTFMSLTQDGRSL